MTSTKGVACKPPGGCFVPNRSEELVVLALSRLLMDPHVQWPSWRFGLVPHYPLSAALMQIDPHAANIRRMKREK